MIDQISYVFKFTPLKKSGSWLPALFFLTSGGLLALMIFAVLGYQLLYLNRSYPGVTVSGVAVGGMSRPEIAVVVSGLPVPELHRPVTIEVADQAWSYTGQQLGVAVDAATTAEQAYQVGRRGSFGADVLTQLSLLSNPRRIEPVVVYNATLTEQVLRQLALEIDYPPQDARLEIKSTSGAMLIPAQRGRRLHVGATQPLIEQAIFHSDEPQPRVVAFTQEVIPAITDDVVTPAYQQVTNLLSTPLLFTYGLTTTNLAEWRLEPPVLAGMLNVIERPAADGKPQLSVAFDRNQLLPYLEEYAKSINQEAVDARLSFDDERGELVVVEPGRDKHALDIPAAQELTAQTIAAGGHEVRLPVTVTPPTIPSDNPELLGIKALVSEATTYFKGSSEGRMRNIALAATRFDGVVVPPGEIFSFNQHLGPVTKEQGYDESLVIYGNRTAVGIGGGVCQVSTTAFRAAFFGGFELVERWAHGYRVSWYETKSTPGLDASIYTPDVDFKFRNDTDHFLLIHTEADTDAGTLTFKFYGTPTDREVIVSEPETSDPVKHGPAIYEDDPSLPAGVIKQVDWAVDGLDVTVSRVVKSGDVVIHQDEIISQYKPWRAVYKVGTGS